MAKHTKDEIIAELLEALKDCRQWLCAHWQGLGTREKLQATERFKRYDAAIRKAEGEE